MDRRDIEGEAYLAGRELLWEGRPVGPDVLRFNTDRTGHPWIDARAREGYRAAFPVRRADGSLQTLVFRYCRQGEPPGQYGKTIALPASYGSTKSAAICRPSIALLSGDSPEFKADEINLVEGPTDFVAATLFGDTVTSEGALRPQWALGCIGVGNAVGVIRAFAAVLRTRIVHIRFDSDEAGEVAARAAESALLGIKARALRARPCRKDLADDWKGEA